MMTPQRGVVFMIHVQIKILETLIEKNETELLGQIGRHEIGIEKAEGILSAQDNSRDWRVEITKADKALRLIPGEAMLEQGKELKPALLKLQGYLTKMITSIPADET